MDDKKILTGIEESKRILTGIEDDVIQGNAEGVVEQIAECLELGILPKDIVEQALLPGMSKVGRLFRDNEVYVVDVILAADAMQNGLEILKPLLSESFSTLNKTIVIGTVENDLHDLGKTIISCSLTAAGFDVVDLGVNVSAEEFIAALEREKPCILALSCTLSYTLQDLKRVVEEVRKSLYGQTVNIVVGGLSVTQSFATSIGADTYALNGEHMVLVAQRLIRETGQQAG